MSILYEERLDGALPDVDRTSVLMALREHVPGLEILHTDEEIIPYECDGLSAYRTRPLLVVLPKQMEQVTAILAVCHRLRVPVVTRGAGTGLSGGALPREIFETSPPPAGASSSGSTYVPLACASSLRWCASETQGASLRLDLSACPSAAQSPDDAKKMHASAEAPAKKFFLNLMISNVHRTTKSKYFHLHFKR